MSRNYIQPQETIVTPILLSVSDGHDLRYSYYTFDVDGEEIPILATSEQEARRLLPYQLDGWYDAS